jgi:S1-C subfamily serine protease
MMTNEMQDYLPPNPPPPPPAEPVGASYSPWSFDPQWGPPSWPPTPQRPSGSSGLRRTALAAFAIICVGAGGGTAWALTTTSASTPSSNGSTLTPGNSNGTGNPPSIGSTNPSTGSISAATVAKIDSALVDITADEAAGNGEVAGTGMIISSNGLVLTNNHVIDDTINIHAQIDGTGTNYTVKVIGYDAKDDVALVQLQGVSNLPTVPIGNSSNVSVGDAITVLGNALGKGGTPAQVSGTITGIGAQITASDDSGDNETLTGMLQVSAAIEPGDSGGAEVDSSGQVIGMTTAGQTSGNPGQETGSTTGFAIPINKAMSIISEIRAGSGTNIHIGNAALLGVAVSVDQPGLDGSTPNCATSEATSGAWVSQVTGNPAASAGVTVCGRITSIGGTTIANNNDLHNAMESFQVGQSVTLTWMDASAVSHSATITLGQAGFPD